MAATSLSRQLQSSIKGCVMAIRRTAIAAKPISQAREVAVLFAPAMNRVLTNAHFKVNRVPTRLRGKGSRNEQKIAACFLHERLWCLYFYSSDRRADH